MKKIIICALLLLTSFIGLNKLNAFNSFKVNSFEIQNRNAIGDYVYVGQLKSEVSFDFTLYNVSSYEIYYGVVDMCSSANLKAAEDYYEIINTGEQCMYTGSSYTGGRKYTLVFNSQTMYETVMSEVNQYITFQFVSDDTYSFEYLNSNIMTQSEYFNYVNNSNYNQEIKNSLNSIEKNQQVTNEKLDDLNQTQQETNNKLDQTNENLDNIDNTLNNDNVDGATDSANSFFENFEDNDYGLSDIIKLPLQYINNISSAKCTPLTFPLPFVDTEVTLPCMKSIYEEYFPDVLYVWQLIVHGFVGYRVLVNIFRIIKNAKNPDNDEIEVVDL